MPAPGFDWSAYDLMLIDNELGEVNAIQWLKFSPHMDRIPPFIVISSTQETDTPAAMESVIHAIRMGAVSYLFKKKIQLDQLNKDITKVLVNAPERADVNTGEIVRQAQESVEDTQHEIHLALAMLEGHAEWPFTMEDILTGKAVIGNYKVVSYLGNHMGGATFKVKRKGQDEPLVMYFISRVHAKDGGLPAERVAELNLMLKLSHPNIMPIKDYQLEDDAILVIRELTESDTLEQRLATQGVYEAQAVEFFRQLLCGLSALHQQAISIDHYTPKSLRVDAQNRLLIADSGLIHRLHAINEVSSDVSTQDSPIYATPEQVQGRVLDRRTDIYIAGLIGYELVAGVPVYSKGSVKDILYAHVTQAVPDLPDKAHPLNSLFQGMLEKTPSKRIQSVGEVLQILDNKIKQGQVASL